MSLQPPEISIYEALLRIESRQFLRAMNATQDYSYLDTPRPSAPIRQASARRFCGSCILQISDFGVVFLMMTT